MARSVTGLSVTAVVPSCRAALCISCAHNRSSNGASRLAVHAGCHRPVAATAAAERDWMPACAVQRGSLLPHEAGSACGAAKHSHGRLHGCEAQHVRAAAPRGGHQTRLETGSGQFQGSGRMRLTVSEAVMSSAPKCGLRDGNGGSLCLLPFIAKASQEPATHRDAVVGPSPVSRYSIGAVPQQVACGM